VGRARGTGRCDEAGTGTVERISEKFRDGRRLEVIIILAITVALLDTGAILFCWFARKEIIAAQLQRDSYKAVATGALQELKECQELLVAMVEEMGPAGRDDAARAKGRN